MSLTKTNVMHVRNTRKERTRFTFLFDWKPVPYCTDYKYLGSNINEFLSFKFTVEKHSESAGRALSVIVTKMIKNNGFPYNVYSLLISACVNSVSDYCAAITGFSQYESLEKVQLRAIRAFLGLPKNTCSSGVFSEVDLLLPHLRTRLIMVRYYHRMLCLSDRRITKKVFIWDRTLNESNRIKTWYSEVREIFTSAGVEANSIPNSIFNLGVTIENLNSSFKKKQMELLSNECQTKPKLRTFLTFKNFQEMPAYITKSFTIHQRRIMAKLRLGCLPLRIETGRYSRPRLNEADRICLICKPGDNIAEIDENDRQPVENEIHFLFQCTAYQGLRDQWFRDMGLAEDFEALEIEDKLKMILNNPTYVKKTSQHILKCMDLRSKLI